ncbi:acyltransferase family protein [Plantactinospora sp. WMMB334]|uniref:acyltransferase family protein n=1 Tax=Plantactinospora sp. WMMB334 TaxID=3404119 RepID=UPI003B931CFE
MATETRPRSRGKLAAPPGHRADLTGLRGLAIGSLLLGTAGPGVVPGGFVGVDIFLVLSGFLVTAALLGQWRRTGQLGLAGFLARRARRALPAGTLVLAASLLLALVCLPRDRWSATGWDVLAGAAHVLNWRLAGQGGQAVTADGTAGLVAHLWVVGVAAQFVLVWAVLLTGVATWVLRRGRLLASPLLIAAGVLVVGSFAWCVAHTGADPARAFLATTTRVWEPALGAALAVIGARLAGLPRRLGLPLGWAGLAALVTAVLTLRPGPAYPGYLALLPVLGTAAIIAGGAAGRPAHSRNTAGTARTAGTAGTARTAGTAGTASAAHLAGTAGTAGPGLVHRMLGARPLRAAGAVSYPLYLWHWPLLVAARARFGDLHTAAEIGVLGGAVLLAVLTHRYVERPLRGGVLDGWSPWQVLRVGTLLPAAGVLGGLLFQLTAWPPDRPAPPPTALAPVAATATPSATAPGAAALGDSPRSSRAGVPVDRVDSITPEPADADTDLPDVYRHRCFSAATGSEARACVYGDRSAPFTVALAGDTHAASWVPALQAVAEAKGWRLITYLRPKCPFLDVPVLVGDEAQQDACAEWYRNVRAELTGAERPGLLLTTGSLYRPTADGRALSGEAAHRALVDGMRRTWSALSATVPTVVLLDTPVLESAAARCVAANPKRLTRCATDREDALVASARATQIEALDDLPRVGAVDLTAAVCPARRCAPVIGGVLVYRDDRHLTATYARTLAPRLRSALDRVVTPSTS